MPLPALVIVTLIAFAANSVLTRAALATDAIGPGAFMTLRLLSGAAFLTLLTLASFGWSKLRSAFDWRTAAALLLYMVGFSYAYVTLETGVGALILFGGVQITMFAGAVLKGERPSAFRWIGSLMGCAGLAVLFLPEATGPGLFGAVLMIGAAVGWGIFSLLGQGAGPALPRTATAFLLASGPGAMVWGFAPAGPDISAQGALLAIASGAFASGLGYAIWYRVLPSLDASLAAIAQLTVPIIALGGGIVWLGEPLTLRFVCGVTLDPWWRRPGACQAENVLN